MKRFLVYLYLFALSGCFKDKEGSNCHYKIFLNNNSDQTISVGIKLISGSLDNRTCNIPENMIMSGSVYELKGPLYTCWEDEIRLSGDFEIFVVDPEKTDDEYGFYDCDFIYVYNKVLRHYKFTLEEMKARDFIINYPEDQGIEPKN